MINLELDYKEQVILSDIIRAEIIYFDDRFPVSLPPEAKKTYLLMLNKLLDKINGNKT